MHLFWQRWAEALDDRAPLSVHAPTIGPRAILRELHEVHAYVAAEEFGKAALEALYEELLGHKAADYPLVRGTLGVRHFDRRLSYAERSPLWHARFDDAKPFWK